MNLSLGYPLTPAFASLLALLAGARMEAQTKRVIPPSNGVALASVALDPVVLDRAARALADSGFRGVVLVASGDSVVMRHAYGAGLDPSSRFWIASMTKAFTAAAVARLAEQGRLALGDSLAAFFPEAPADKRGITVRQLLTHTAGLGGTYSGAGLTDRGATVRAILAPPLEFPPGHGYRYGDDDYELLAAIVEVAANDRWERVVRRELIEPLGLRHTGFWSDTHRGADDDWAHRGANGMASTADDLLRWTRAFGAMGDLAAPHVFVRKEEGRAVFYGYGARVYVEAGRVTEVMHSGSGDDGHTGVALVWPSGVSLVVLSDAGRRGEATWSAVVAHRLADAAGLPGR